MNSIKIFIYSYKNKNLLEQLKDIIGKQSNKVDTTYYIYDQNNINRDFAFNNIQSNIVYTHIRWDDIRSITYYRNMAILNYSNTKYYLEINPNISLMNEWDIFFISNIENKKIISGFGIPNLSIDRHYVKVKRQESFSVQEVNYIDTDLIFCSQLDAMNLIKLKKLKEFGQDFFASIIFVNKGYKIYSLPSRICYKKIQENINTYKAFSKNHGYNEMILSVQKDNNEKFESFHNISIQNIQQIPYQINDVLYSDYKISLENMSMPRFLSGYNQVQIT